MRGLVPGALIAVCVLAALPGVAASEPGPAGPPLSPRLVLPGLASDPKLHPEADALAAARERWAAAGIQGYDLVVDLGVFGTPHHWESSVRGGAVVSATESCTLGGQPYPCDQVPLEPTTVPSLFAFIEQQLAGVEEGYLPPQERLGRQFLEAEYDANGVPRTVRFGLRGVPDGEALLTIQFFELQPESLAASGAIGGLAPGAVMPGLAADGIVHPQGDALAAARERWAAAGVQDYDLMVDFRAYGPHYQWESAVRGTAVNTRQTCLNGGEPAPCQDIGLHEATVPGLYAFIEEQLAQVDDRFLPLQLTFGEPYIEVEYDSAGVPVTVAWGLLGVPDGSGYLFITWTPVD